MFCLSKIYNTQFLNNLKPIIEVNHVWKEYQKGIDRRYKSLRDTLVGMPNRLLGTEKEKFWALEDIDFKVEAGESVGIIGRNGAGKSTLLKILSRITPPTKGEIILRGRVASLLEVGTGFHPELTGRENVFFNGSILGMKHAEIKHKFDEIVDFSGVESFIDTPLKHYSSGMQMRLAFSVAAHLDSEILLIDEVLAVGDAEFQKKCIGKMDDVSKGDGKSILFVSHDVNAISNLSQRGIILDLGLKIFESNIIDALNKYVEITSHNRNISLNNSPRIGNGIVRISQICISSISNETSSFLKPFDDVNFSIEFAYNKESNLREIKLDLGINNLAGKRVTWMTAKKFFNDEFNQSRKIEFIVEKFPLVPGEYTINLHCEVNNQIADWIKNVGEFKILNNKYFDTNLRIPQGQGDVQLQYTVK